MISPKKQIKNITIKTITIMEIKITYILDNDNWSDIEFEEAQEKTNVFVITEDMLKDLILQNVKLDIGNYPDQIYYDSMTAKRF